MYDESNDSAPIETESGRRDDAEELGQVDDEGEARDHATENSRWESDREDQELLRRWSEGDLRAADELVTRYSKLVYSYFVNKTFNQSDVNDLMQETLRVLHEKVVGGTEIKVLRRYLHGIARNVLLKYIEKRIRKDSKIDPLEHSIEDLGAGPATIVARNQKRQLLFNALRKIPLERQIILEYRIIQGLTYREIAEILEINPQTARSRFLRGKNDLERVMRRMRPTPPEDTCDD